MRREIAPKINRDSKNIRILKNENGEIDFDGAGFFAQKLDVEKSAKILKKVIEKNIDFATLAVRKSDPQISLDENLQSLGTKNLLAVGESDFSGSPANRVWNIRTGARKFNGRILRRGEIFSFNEILGKIDAAAGFRPELVIKGAFTVPELGGGLCQVSTTAFRAALLAGLKIVERHAHAYAVNYYKPHGTDATIYSGGKNLRFLNDTAAPILIQTKIVGNKLFFHFYGARDTRRALIFGPRFSNFKIAPAPREILKNDLPAGIVKIVSGRHDGFNALWFQLVRRESGAFLEKIFSQFDARGIVKLVGVAPKN